MPLSKTVRFAYAFAVAFPLALAHPAAPPSRGKPAEAAPPQVTVRDTTVQTTVSHHGPPRTRAGNWKTS